MINTEWVGYFVVFCFLLSVLYIVLTTVLKH